MSEKKDKPIQGTDEAQERGVRGGKTTKLDDGDLDKVSGGEKSDDGRLRADHFA